MESRIGKVCGRWDATNLRGLSRVNKEQPLGVSLRTSERHFIKTTQMTLRTWIKHQRQLKATELLNSVYWAGHYTVTSSQVVNTKVAEYGPKVEFNGTAECSPEGDTLPASNKGGSREVECKLEGSVTLTGFKTAFWKTLQLEAKAGITVKDTAAINVTQWCQAGGIYCYIPKKVTTVNGTCSGTLYVTDPLTGTLISQTDVSEPATGTSTEYKGFMCTATFDKNHNGKDDARESLPNPCYPKCPHP